MRCLRHRGLFEECRLAGLIPEGSQLIGSRDENNGFRPLRGRMSEIAGYLLAWRQIKGIGHQQRPTNNKAGTRYYVPDTTIRKHMPFTGNIDNLPRSGSIRGMRYAVCGTGDAGRGPWDGGCGMRKIEIDN